MFSTLAYYDPKCAYESTSYRSEKFYTKSLEEYGAQAMDSHKDDMIPLLMSWGCTV